MEQRYRIPNPSPVNIESGDVIVYCSDCAILEGKIAALERERDLQNILSKQNADQMIYMADRIHELEAENAALKQKYNELSMAVPKKYPGETRHETALRYIKQAECHTGDCCAKTEGEGDGAEI